MSSNGIHSLVQFTKLVAKLLPEFLNHIFAKFSVSINCGNYSAISCSLCRYDPYSGVEYPGNGWCAGDCAWDAGHCVPAGILRKMKR